MKVVCIKNTAQNIDLEEEITIKTQKHEYWLELGKEYLVMGILQYSKSNCIYYLLDVSGRPFFFPYMLFEITDNSLPGNWYYKKFKKSDSLYINFICGYKEFCEEENYYEKLVEREETANITYFKRKIEYEKYYDDLQYL